MSLKFVSKIKHISHNIFHNITVSRLRKRVFKKFANKLGLIYFGSVDKTLDEHRVVRGFSVSSTHIDNHYCVGAFDGYDVTIVDRSDVVTDNNGVTNFNNWLIMSFDLQSELDVPHVFINANNHDKSAYNLFFKINPTFAAVNLGTFENYGREFTSRFTIYSAPSDFIEVEKLFPADSTRIIGTHFWPFSAEVKDKVLYIYTSDKKITTSTLNSMMSNGIWLARNIDSRIESI